MTLHQINDTLSKCVGKVLNDIAVRCFVQFLGMGINGGWGTNGSMRLGFSLRVFNAVKI